MEEEKTIGADVKNDNVKRPEFTLISGIVIGVAVVSAITIVTLVIQYFTATQATFQDLKDQITSQNAKIDILITQSNSKK